MTNLIASVNQEEPQYSRLNMNSRQGGANVGNWAARLGTTGTTTMMMIYAITIYIVVDTEI